MKDGVYRTQAGSEFTVTGGSYRGVFDSYEEENACYDCEFSDLDMIDQRISWSCTVCDGGSAELIKVDL